ncbi:S41 family peptidase [Curvivirga sp.]|uniref:S41 family peptidase n=1 Tax=Curvivirga sp. TaxID=2856848 RepID=UPI003B596E51
MIFIRLVSRQIFLSFLVIIFLAACARKPELGLDIDPKKLSRHYYESIDATRRLATLNDEEEKILLRDGEISHHDLENFRLIYMIARTYHIETIHQSAILEAAWDAIRTEVAENGKVSERAYEAFAIDGFLSSLDQYSHFYDLKTNYKKFDNMAIGVSQFGALMMKVPLGLQVIGLKREGVAHVAGVRVSDIIKSANDIELSNLNERLATKEVVNFYSDRMRLEIIRNGNVIDPIVIPRQTRSEPEMLSSYVENNTAVIRLADFDDHAAKYMKVAIADAFDETNGSLTGIILDVRSNPGGDLDEAIGILDLFLPKGSPFGEMVGKHDKQQLAAEEADFSRNLPMVILQDAGSASASELVAGVLKVNKRATVIGEKSYGKDVAQSVIPLNDKSGLVVLTTSRYFLPLGESVKGGLRPDILVKDDPDLYGDEQMKAAFDFIRKAIDKRKQAAHGS